jgi:hypothetical protein
MALERFDLDLHRVEEEAAGKKNDRMADYVLKMVNRIRELDHELNHPNYTYASGRIGRSALVYRNQEIQKLQEQVRHMSKELEEERKIERVPCTQAKPGWRCTRGRGHTGPCAALPIPVSDKTDLHDRD